MRMPWHKPASAALGDLVQRALGPVVQQHGLATSEIIARWDDLVGERFARVTRPIRVLWPRLSSEIAEDGAREPATLVVRCEGAHALDLQHSAPVIIERINVLYGWRAIARLSIRQGPIDKPARRHPLAEPPPAPAHIQAGIDKIEDPGLRTALERLGRVVSAEAKRARLAEASSKKR